MSEGIQLRMALAATLLRQHPSQPDDMNDAADALSNGITEIERLEAERDRYKDALQAIGYATEPMNNVSLFVAELQNIAIQALKESEG